MRKYRKVNIAKVSLATSGKQVSVETIKVPCEPNTAHVRLDRLLPKVPLATSGKQVSARD